MKLATFFILSTVRIFTKLLAISESSIKIKKRLFWTFSQFCLLQQLFANKSYCEKTLLSNIFKTATVIMLAKTILECHYKEVLQGS